MRITLNNIEEEFDKSQMTIDEIIKVKNYTFKLLVTKLNGKVVKTEERDSTPVKDGDELHIIHLISGG